MKQGNNCSLLPSYFEEHEHEVASILLDLPLVIDQSKPSAASASSHHSIPFFWSAKRKRSCLSRGGRIDSSPSTAALSPSPSLRDAQQPLAAVEKSSAARGESKPKEEKEGSPTTPLSLSLSEEEESGENPPRCKRRVASAVSKKQSRKDLMEKVAESAEQRKVLRKEIENVTRYYKTLEEENSKLKAIEEQLRLGKQEKRPGSTETQLAQPRAGSVVVNENAVEESLIRKVGVVPPCSSSCSSSGNNNNNGSGAIGIDLNSGSGNVNVCFPVGEGRWEESILGDCWLRRFDDSGLRAATAATARKRRIEKRREQKERRRRGLTNIRWACWSEKNFN
ncbi:unnamed protein product [Linum trigynum]|uniref:BZIP domain-containing protein n=1 Tax=Linum trigynum TaxID=586398 RepID=A0AAV2EED3_9ROSI